MADEARSGLGAPTAGAPNECTGERRAFDPM